MKSIWWYINRLSKMSFPEIAYRVGHKIREKIDQHHCGIQPPTLPETFQLDLSRLFSLSHHITPERLESWVEESQYPLVDFAGNCCCNRYTVFGIEYDFKDRINWHLDPKTGNHWPLKFWRDVDISDGFTIGGAKFVWEVNRFYGLTILGMAFRLTGEKKYADKFFSLVDSWLKDNPYPLGVNWTCGIELGIRMANLVWGLSYLEEYDISPEKSEILSRFAWLHGRHLYRYPSRYSSNNNHAIAEAFALFLIGVYFPGFTEAKKWLTFGKEVLDREVKRQILPDGGSYEYTTTYLSFIFDFFLLYKLVCEKTGLQYDLILDDRLEQSCEFIYSLMDQGGNIPNIGDQDSAILVNFGLDNQTNFESILNTGSILYHRPEFRRPGFPDLKTLLLLGDRITVDTVHTAEKRKPGTRLFRESGLAVIRGECHGEEIIFTGNAMPLGMPPLYAHGHLDALSLTLSVAGVEFLIDPGTYLYHSGGRWRRYFRSTVAHNTVRINETDMTEQVADFMFGKPYRIVEHSLTEREESVIWRTGHDAYKKLDVTVLHFREVKCNFSAGSLEIVDFLKSSGVVKAEQFFHFHPECLVKVDGAEAVVTRGNLGLKMYFDSRMSIDLLKGSHNPLLGWYSKAFNHLEESYSLVCQGRFSGDAVLKSVIKVVT